MGKSLTIDELKALSEGDWVYIVDYHNNTTLPPHTTERYYRVVNNATEKLMCMFTGYSFFDYSTYGKDWIAYKNKEQANAVCEESVKSEKASIDETEINKLAKTMCSSYGPYCGCGCRVEHCPIEQFAQNAINAGYRKSREIVMAFAENLKFLIEERSGFTGCDLEDMLLSGETIQEALNACLREFGAEVK